MSTRRRLINSRFVSVAAVCVIALIAAMGGMNEATDRSSATVYAEFTDASPLVVGNDIKVSGVTVGRISSIEVTEGRARVGLQLEDAALPLHKDARVKIRPVSLLGERYVDLDRGTPSKPALEPGATLAVSQTARSVALHQILSSIDQPTGKGLAVLLTTLGEGVRGQGADVDATIRALAPALTDTRALVDVLDRQTALLTDLIDQVQPVASALSADEGRTLNGLLTASDRVLGVAEQNQQELAASMEELPSTLKAARRTLSNLSGVAEETTPTLRSLRPLTDDLTQFSGELLNFADAADPALASLAPVLSKAETLVDEAAPLAADLRAVGPQVEGVAQDARPVLNALMKRDLRDVMDFIRNWALTTNGRDGLSHYFRAHVVASPELVTGLLPGGTPGNSAPKSPLGNDQGEDSAGSDGLVSDLLGGDSGLLSGLLGGGQSAESGDSRDSGGLLGGLLGGGQKDAKGSERDSTGGATGLTQDQEKSLLGFLMGGS